MSSFSGSSSRPSALPFDCHRKDFHESSLSPHKLEFPVSVIKVTDLDLKGKRVFIRADLNVPVKDGKVTSDARITASMATINYCLDRAPK